MKIKMSAVCQKQDSSIWEEVSRNCIPFFLVALGAVGLWEHARRLSA